MKNYKITNLLRDYDFVSRAIENPNNKRQHIIPLLKLVSNFNLKYDDLYFERTEYFLDLSLKIRNLQMLLKNKY